MPSIKQTSYDIKELMTKDTRYKRVISVMLKHRKKQDALIEVLHAVEDVFGYIPIDVMKFISHEMKISPSRIYGVVTFYHFFSLKPKGEHNCVICTGTACHVKGAGEVLQKIQNRYQIKPGETTQDGKIGLQTARCLGCCGLAPVVVVDDEILARMEPDQAVASVEKKLGSVL